MSHHKSTAMGNFASTSIPKPKNWQDFESYTCILFQCILNDPNTIAHGRTGQAQHGVDIYGRRDLRENNWVGVQCKLKGESQHLTEAELKKEVEEAKKFQPGLSELIVVTTASDDTKIQRVARNITERHVSKGLFSVHVWGWGTLEREISKYPEAIRAFHPDISVHSNNLISQGQEILSVVSSNKENSLKILEKLEGIEAVLQWGLDAADESSAVNETIEKNIHEEIDGYRDLLHEGKAVTAKGLLEALKARLWKSASPRVRFRITTNIGAALLKIGDEESAAERFFEAIEYDKCDPIGLANVALAYLLKRQLGAAVLAAQRALDVDKGNAIAASYLISGHIEDFSVSDPFSLVPELLHNTPEVLVSAIYFFSRRKDPKWRRLARQAIRVCGNEPQIQRFAAEAILDEAVSLDSVVIGGVSDSELTFTDVEWAVGRLQEMWSEVQEFETKNIDVALPYNLALAYRLLNEDGLAAKVVDQALEYFYSDKGLRELRAVLYFENGDLGKAIELLGDQKISLGCAVCMARAFVTSDPSRALKIIQDEDFSAAPLQQKLAAEQVTIEAFLKEGRLDDALAHAESVVNANPNHIAALVFFAQTQRKCGCGGYEETFSRALVALNRSSNFSDRILLASALEEAGRFGDVVDVLSGYVDLAYDSYALRLLLFSSINADLRKYASSLISKLSQEIASKPPYLRALVAMHSNRGDYSSARLALDEYLGLRPNDLEMRLRWFQYCFRLNDQESIKTYLSGDVERIEGPPELRIELAHWLQHVGFYERAISLAYRELVFNTISPAVHLRYMGLIFSPGSNMRIPLDINIIENHVAFEIDDGKGGQEWFVIEPAIELRKDETYIDPNSDIGRKALGLKVGECIEWGEQLASWTILQIKHKYLHALHTSLNVFERHFPTNTSLRKFSFNPQDEEPFEQLLIEVKNRSDQVQKAFDILDRQSVPIHLVSSILGGDIIDVRSSLNNLGRKHRVCAGTEPERARAFKAIESNFERGCIVDALTLQFIIRLGIERAVLSVCGPIYITGYTRDLYWKRVQEMKASGPQTTLHWEGGQYFRHQASSGEWMAALGVRESDLNWIDENAKVVPAEGSIDPPEELRKINELIGQWFIDDMLASQSDGLLLLCQDQTYRVIAEQYLGVVGSWIQPVLIIARDRNILTSEEYCNAVTELIRLGDDFISIDAVMLIEAANLKDASLERFDFIAKQLVHNGSLNFSQIKVAAIFFGIVWSVRPHELITSKQTSLLLENLLHGTGGWQKTIAILRLIFQINFGRSEVFDHYLLSWLKGHFLVPIDSKYLPTLSV